MAGPQVSEVPTPMLSYESAQNIARPGPNDAPCGKAPPQALPHPFLPGLEASGFTMPSAPLPEQLAPETCAFLCTMGQYWPEFVPPALPPPSQAPWPPPASPESAAAVARWAQQLQQQLKTFQECCNSGPDGLAAAQPPGMPVPHPGNPSQKKAACPNTSPSGSSAGAGALGPQSHETGLEAGNDNGPRTRKGQSPAEGPEATAGEPGGAQSAKPSTTPAKSSNSGGSGSGGSSCCQQGGGSSRQPGGSHSSSSLPGGSGRSQSSNSIDLGDRGICYIYN